MIVEQWLYLIDIIVGLKFFKKVTTLHLWIVESWYRTIHDRMNDTAIGILYQQLTNEMEEDITEWGEFDRKFNSYLKNFG